MKQKKHHLAKLGTWPTVYVDSFGSESTKPTDPMTWHEAKAAQKEWAEKWDILFDVVPI